MSTLVLVFRKTKISFIIFSVVKKITKSTYNYFFVFLYFGFLILFKPLVILKKVYCCVLGDGL